MSRAKPINVVCAALFAGIILTFSFYFGISAMTDNTRASETETVADGMTFAGFSESYYCNDDMKKLIRLTAGAQ